MLFEAGMLFGPDFLRDHVGQIMSDPRIAIIELVANSYDAGATTVGIVWPQEKGQEFQIEDNGTGMTAQQFESRWRTLGYKRSQEQSPLAEWPVGTKGLGKRFAFGQSGKGRHGAFCFADEYRIETWRDGSCLSVRVRMTAGGTDPFAFDQARTSSRSGHGTRIRAKAVRNVIPVQDVSTAIGLKFLVDPKFAVTVNGQPLELMLLSATSPHVIAVPEVGDIQILSIDPQASDRTTHLRGITWWVNGRMVGTPSWDGLDERGAILDGRTAEAKRFSFVVMADPLHKEVKQDWTGFHVNERVTAVLRAVREHIIKSLNAVLSQSRKERKKAALNETKQVLGELSTMSRKVVGEFADQLLVSCPTLSQGDLSRTLSLFANLEKSRSGYELLTELASCAPDDIDRWTGIMKRWSASEAEQVLNELQWRLELLAKLQTLLDRGQADELHELQPLFERGLWIFGPEFESVEFRSNRTLVTVVRELLGGSKAAPSKDRPDFVALPDRSIGLYSADSYDCDSEVNGIAKVLVVELKHGGASLSREEVAQPERYVVELRRANHVQPETRFSVFVLGSTLGDDAADSRTLGPAGAPHTVIVPMKYSTVLQRANARTFNLLAKVKSAFPAPATDAEVESVLQEPEQRLFDGTVTVLTAREPAKS